jgi:hypothetical protein
MSSARIFAGTQMQVFYFRFMTNSLCRSEFLFSPAGRELIAGSKINKTAQNVKFLLP